MSLLRWVPYAFWFCGIELYFLSTSELANTATASESDWHLKLFLPFSLASSSWRYRMNCGLQLLVFHSPLLFLEPRRPVNNFWNNYSSEVLERESYCSENKSSRTWLSLTCPCEIFVSLFLGCLFVFPLEAKIFTVSKSPVFVLCGLFLADLSQ